MTIRTFPLALVLVAGCGGSPSTREDAHGSSDGAIGEDALRRDASADDAARGDGATGDGAVPASDEVWFTGDTMPVLHYDGTQVVATSSAANTYETAWGSSATNIYVLAWDGGVIHYDGATWTTSRTATGQTRVYSSLFGASATDVWGLGEVGTILRFNGSTWSSTTNGTISNWAACLWGTSSNDLWAIGYSPQNHHWDGTQWHDVPNLLGIYMFAAWGASGTDIWAVGQTLNQGTTPNTSTIAHYNGSSWSLATVPPELNQHGQVLNAVWGASASDVWAVGSAGLVAHWNGVAWARVDAGTTHDLITVGGSGSASVWAAGAQGTILHRGANGTWAAIASGTTKSIYGMWVRPSTIIVQ